jgi:hypothetical protein
VIEISKKDLELIFGRGKTVIPTSSFFVPGKEEVYAARKNILVQYANYRHAALW